jgi:hypothetical protein
LKKHLWSIHDHGIYAADQIAVAPNATAHGCLKVPASDIIAFLQQHMGYYISDERGPLLHSISEIIAANEHQSYLHNRVHLYNSSYDWTDTSTAFAAKIWNLAASDLPTAETNVRIMYDKMWHGRNQGKNTRQIFNCPLCNLKDSQEHLFFECTHADIALARQRLKLAAAEEIQRASEDESIRSFTSQVVDYAMTSERRGQLIVGLFNPQDEQHVNALAIRSRAPTPKLKKSFITTFRVITKHLAQMWSARHKLESNMAAAAPVRESRTEDTSTHLNDINPPHMYINPMKRKYRPPREPP